MARARAFHESMLGITLERLPAGDLEMWAPHAPRAGGALVHVDEVKAGGASTVGYFHCDDCAAEASRAQAAGGRVHRPKMSIGPYGWIALVVDTEGNMVGLHSMA